MDEKKEEVEVTANGELSQGTDPAKSEVKKPKRKWTNVFRYASHLDVVLMLIGTLCAIAHGVALPFLFNYFGDLTNSFITQAISSNIAQNISNLTGMDIDCSSVFNVTFDSNISLVDATVSTILENVQQFSSSKCLLGDEFIESINVIVYIMVGISVAVFIVALVQVAGFQWAAERQTHKIRLKYYRAIIRQDIAWFDANPTGELVNRLSDDINKIYAGIGDKLAIFIQWITTFFAGFAVAFYRDWRLTLLLLALTPFMALSGAVLSKLTVSFTNKELNEYASAGGVAEEVLSSIRTVFAFGGEKKEVMRYEDKLNQARRLGVKKGFSVGVTLAIVLFFLFMLYSISFWFGGYLIQSHGAQGGDILTTFFSVIVGAFSLGKAAPFLEDILTAVGAAVTVYETINRIPPIDSHSDEGLKPEKLDPNIKLRNVDFTYPSRPDIQVMHNVTFEVEVGQTVALVGPSGCGKSTVVQLIQRFYDVTAGEVLVGGVNVKDLNLKWLRGHIGIVSQEPVLFDTTIAENIRYGKEEATIEEIQEAARKANAHDFITSLPKGYDTNVGEGGTQLSGGQKQRVAIARALVSNPRILLLDEATSALDTESEKVVQEALDKAREGRTTIVIAHRLSTIRNANIIVSIKNGCVVEIGSHAELMEKKGLYHDLVDAQSFGTDELFIQCKSLNRLVSHASAKQEFNAGSNFKKQASFQHQKSADGKDLKKELEKKQDEWDKDIPDVALKRIIALNAKEWWIIIFGVLGAALGGTIFPAFAIFFGEVIRVFSLPPDEILAAMHLWAGLYLALASVSGVGAFLKTLCFTVSGENLTTRLRSLLFKAFLRQEVAWYDDERNSTGALTTRLAHDAGQVQGATGSRIGTIIETFVGLLLALGIALAYSWLITLVILGLAPLIIVAGSLQLKIFTNHAAKIKKDLEIAGKLAVDSIDNIRTVASLTIEDNFVAKYTNEVNKPYKSSLLIHPPIYGLTYGFSQAVIYLMYGIVFRFGAFLVIQSPNSILHVEFEDVFRVFMAIIFGAFSAGQATAFAPNYSKAKLSAKRIFAILDRVPEIDNFSEDGETLEKPSGAVAVDSVNFSYPARPEVLVLQDLSLDLKPGQTMALVGPSGCGKSTVVSLMERFYDPSSGSLKFDGVDCRDLNLRWLRSQMGIVSQEPVLFDASIAENIRYGALFREVSEDEVISAAKAANIHDFIETLPMGYNTNVGAKGTQLSGGQKQRIAIARALVRDPKILLLDEATSALDTESEKVVQEALDKASEGRTTIIIAHRLSTIYNSDAIAVIKGGKVLEIGTHSELLAKRGLYYKLNRFQVVEEENIEM